MANRFCSNCGTKLLTGAAFCVECGERQPGAKVRRAGFAMPLQRYAPLFVILSVVAVGAGAVLSGRMNPTAPPALPGRGGSEAPADTGGSLPQGHPPIAIPDQVKQSIRDMQKKAEAAPDDMDAWKRLAEIDYRAGQLDAVYLPDAAAAYRHVLEHEPQNLEVIRNLGNIAYDQDQHDIAAGYYQEYLKLKPDDLSVQTDLGTMYLSAGKPEEAVKVYATVLQTDPSFFQAEFNLAIAYRAMNQTDKALAALEKSRTLAPDDKTRTQVEQLLARVKGEPAGPPVGAPPAAAAAASAEPAGGTFETDAEAIFRQNPIMGPKVQRVEWAGSDNAKVYLKDFPMDQMPPEMLTMFTDRMKGRIKEKKDAHNLTQTVRFDLIDAATGKVMNTLTE